MTSFELAARRGRGDLLKLLRLRGLELQFDGVERLIAFCALGNSHAAHALAAAEPRMRTELLSHGSELLAEFAGNGNVNGVRILIELGVSVNCRYGGDSYFEIAKDSTALHVAAWKSWPGVAKLLTERGADVNVIDGHGRSPLMLAVKVCVNSLWVVRRSPELVEVLLQAGAITEGINTPCGYDPVDRLLNSSSHDS